MKMGAEKMLNTCGLKLLLVLTVLSLAGVTEAATRSWSYDYYANGQLRSVDGPRTNVNDTTYYEYDGKGNLFKITNALGHEQLYTDYNVYGDPTRLVNQNGIVTTLEYDLFGRITKSSTDAPSGPIETFFEYDPFDNLSRLTLPTGAQLILTNDVQGNVLSIENDQGDQLTFERDAMGKLVEKTSKDANGEIAFSINYAYNLLGYLSKITRHDGGHISYEPDYDGKVLKEWDTYSSKIAPKTSYKYDYANRIKLITGFNGYETRFRYDQPDHPLTELSTSTSTTRFAYNGFGEKIQETSSNSGTTNYLRDEAGNIIRKTLADGSVTEYGYDALNRLVSVNYPTSPEQNVTYEYDNTLEGGYAVGKLTKISWANHAISFEYDYEGRIVRKTSLYKGLEAHTYLSYDLLGNVSSMTYPSGRVVSYQRDNYGRVLEITTQGANDPSPEVVITQMNYQPYGEMLSAVLGNGITQNYSYNLSGETTEIIASNAYAVSVGRDLTGNVDAINNLLDSSTNQQFFYNGGHQLISANGDYGVIDYAYDGSGNRISKSDSLNGFTSYDYEPGTDRVSTEGSSDVWNYLYDPKGNILSKKRSDGNGFEFKYSHSNRLATALSVSTSTKGKNTTTTKEVLAAFEYNPLGQRVYKESNTSIRYIYDINGTLVAEQNLVGLYEKEYIYSEGKLIAVVTNEVESSNFTPEEVIVDSVTNTSFEGSWSSISNRNTYSNEAFLSSGSSSDVFRWSAQVEGGEYDLYAWWPSKKSYTSAAIYTVASGSLAYIADPVSQKGSGGQWNLIGSFALNTGQTEIYLTSDGDPAVADSIRLVQTAPLSSGSSISSNLFYAHTDHLGTPKVLTDANANSVWQIKSLPFGESIVFEDPDGDGKTVTINLRMPGQYYDAETSLHYNYYRDYDPSLGRYIQSDPIGGLYHYDDPQLLVEFDKDSKVFGAYESFVGLAAKQFLDPAYETGTELNLLYGYANSNPLNVIDPLGLAPKRPKLSKDVCEMNCQDMQIALHRLCGLNLGCRAYVDQLVVDCIVKGRKPPGCEEVCKEDESK